MRNLNNDDFKVEELEQRLEMAEWSNESSGSKTSGDCSGNASAKLTINIFNMKNFLLITIFLLSTVNFYSQKFLILDSLNNKPVTFANIQFLDNKGTITNEDGIFKVNSSEQFIISAGFKS
jgi:hypothetical protein